MVPKPRLHPSPTTALLVLLATAAHAGSHNDLSAEAASHLPECARDCFRSFVDVNFPDIDCSGASSSLECVCRQAGASGYTVGEGAVQCLLAAKAVGLCSDAEGNGVSDSAYRMCADEPHAVRPTNPTIEATLRVDKSSRLIVPTPGLSIVTSHDATDSPTTIASPVTVTASFSQPTSRTTETDAAPTPGDAEGAQDEDEEPGPTGRFSTAEIAGLAAGLVAAFAIAIILIFLARRRRKKHFPDVETRFFMSNRRMKSLSQRLSFMPTGQNISSPLHGASGAPPKQFPMGEQAPLDRRRRTFIFPTAAQRSVPPVRTVPSGTAAPVAGAAVTAASAVPMGNSRSGSPQNTQQRPVLSLAIPENPRTSSPRPQKPAPKREQTPPHLLVTAPTFEREPETARKTKKAAKPTVPTVEEDDSPLTEFEEDDRDSPIQVWRPPSGGPLYFGSGTSNWKLAALADERQKKRISRAELEGSSPVVTNKGGNIPSQAQPKAPEPPRAAGALRPPAEIQRGGARRDMPSAASSVYSTDMPAWNSSSPAPPVPTHPMLPRPLATRQPPPARPRYSPVLNPFLDENGVSPVRSMFGSMRAPPRTHASPRVGARPTRVGSPPGQPSPTLGAVTPPRGQRGPRSQSSQPRTPERSYNPVPAAAFRASPAQPPSLLAKRVGSQKAATLSLRDSEESRRGGRGSGGRGQLPSTPTWNPLLTPERRGGDLYLSLR